MRGGVKQPSPRASAQFFRTRHTVHWSKYRTASARGSVTERLPPGGGRMSLPSINISESSPSVCPPVPEESPQNENDTFNNSNNQTVDRQFVEWMLLSSSDQF